MYYPKSCFFLYIEGYRVCYWIRLCESIMIGYEREILKSLSLSQARMK